jgi:hypothetical protein
MATVTPGVGLLVQDLLGACNYHLSCIIGLNQSFATKATSICLPLYLCLLQRLLAFSTGRVVGLRFQIHLVIQALLRTVLLGLYQIGRLGRKHWLNIGCLRNAPILIRSR